VDQAIIIGVAREALITALLVAGPPIIFSLAVGLTISIFQAVTQVNEPTLTFVPKILAVFVSLVLFGPWMLSRLVSLVARMLEQMTFAIR